MSTVRIAWDENQANILHYYFEARWNWEDAYAAYAQAHALIESAAMPVGVILSGPENMILPPNMLTHTRKLMTQKKSPYTKVIVIMTKSAFVQIMANILTKLITTELHTATDFETARKIISDRLATIKD